MLLRALALIVLLIFAGSAASSPVIIRLNRDATSKGPLPVKRGGQWGFVDTTGKIVIEPAYEMADFFYEERAAVRTQGKWGFIDFSGKMVVPAQYSTVHRFSDGLAHVMTDGGTPETRIYGYVQKNGEIAFNCPAACGRPFSDGMMGESVDIYRCVDENGKPVPKKYPCTPDQNSNSRAIMVDTWGFYDHTGKLAIPGIFHSGLSRFSEGLAAVQPHGTQTMGFINRDAAFIIPPQFARAEAFSEGLAAVQIADKWGFVDRSGTIVIAAAYDSVGPFSDGLAQVFVGQRYGYIDKKGGQMIFPRFEEASPFSDGLAAACCEDGKTGYIAKSGMYAIAPTFDRYQAQPFSEGVALVRLSNGDSVYIDRKGKVITRMEEPVKPVPVR